MSSNGNLKPSGFAENAALFILGVGAVATLQAMGGWWLDSGIGVLRAVLVLVVLGVATTRWRPERSWVRACALWTGAISGTTVVLFWRGPGNIWPIVLVIAAGITAAAVFGGAFLGARFRVNRRSALEMRGKRR
jgi:hypothetical protein